MRSFKWIIGFLLSLFLLGIFLKSYIARADPPTTIELESLVHFLAPDGSDLRMEAGTYTVEPAEEWIRLMSSS